MDVLTYSRRLRRKRLLLKIVLAFIAVLLVLGGVIGLFYIPKFRIQEISIEGVNTLDKEEFIAVINNILKQKFWKIFPYENIFIFPAEKITAELLPKFPIIKKISFQRDFPQTLHVLVEERKPAGLLCKTLFSKNESLEALKKDEFFDVLQTTECAFLDENGFVFQVAPNFSGAIFPKFFDNRQQSATNILTALGNTIMNPLEFQKLLFLMELLSQKKFTVTKIILKDEGTYEIHLKDWYILLNDKNEPQQSLDNLELVLNQTIQDKILNLEYIDLRFGNKVFYKFK